MKLLFILLVCFVSGIRSHLNTKVEQEISDEDKQIYGLPENDTSIEENDKHADDKKNGENLDCSKDEIENKQGLLTISGMIKKGEEFMNQQSQKTDDTILVIGNAGVGKTSFVQFLAGDNSKLISQETGIGTGHFLIEDGVKIGSSVTESLTLYPEKVVIDNETSFTDTPGFSDTRSEKHEMVATYIMKKYLQGIKNIKIVILVPYNSLELGQSKNDFVDTLRNVNNFIKHIDKFKGSIILVSTKVPRMFRIINKNVIETSDEQIIKNIASYIIQVKISLKEKLKYSNENKQNNFLENAIKIIEYLLDEDENSHYEKINLFRQPSESGVLSTMSSLQEGKKSLKKSIFSSVNYSKLSYDDIGYTLSHKAKIYLNCLLRYINDNITKMSSHVFHMIENHYRLKVQNLTDIYALRSMLEKLVRKLKSFKSNLKESQNYKNYSSIITKFIGSEKIQTVNENYTFYEIHDDINSLEQYTDTGSIFSTLEWAEQMKTLINNVKENLSWCDLQIKVIEYFSSYEVQKLKTKYSNMIDLKQAQNDPRNWLFLNFDKIFLKDRDLYLNLLTSSTDKVLDVFDIISLTLLNQSNISCNTEGKLSVTGHYVRLGEISTSDIINNYCGIKPVKLIVIYATNTVFIDADLSNDYFRGVNIMIAAPKWEIIGKRTININGSPGKNHNNSKADDGIEFGDNGNDGMPGFPGGNGGNFLGTGLYFINEDNLIIEANGGNGGPGQDGGNGKDGKAGKQGHEKLINNTDFYIDDEYIIDWYKSNSELKTFDEKWINEVVNAKKQLKMNSTFCESEIKFYKQTGDCGKIGGRGGNGGLSGFGGYAGKVLIVGGDATPKFTVFNSQGNLGHPGKGGEGGKTGEIGKSFQCYRGEFYQLSHHYICPSGKKFTIGNMNSFFWKCWYSTETTICPDNSAAGFSNNTSTGILEPDTSQNYDFSDYLYNYTLILKENEDNKYLSNYSLKFQNEIYKKISSMNSQLMATSTVLSDL